MQLDTASLSTRFRAAVLELHTQRVLITKYTGTLQARDLAEPPNCDGLGRIRHFRRKGSDGWSSNPLPIDPASRALGCRDLEVLRAQVFQIAACNWRCWYCFVPFELLSANPRYAEWLSARELIGSFLAQESPPKVLDLSGGEPSLIPEWPLWVIEELQRRGLDRQYYVWTDDNLSTDYFWRFLTPAQQEFVATHPMYGRVGCFKGFDAESFAYTTRAAPALFDYQFAIMSRLVASGMDVYAYVTFMTPAKNIGDSVRGFVDRLQAIDENMPLRTVPLEVQVFSPVVKRLNDAHRGALKTQWLALEIWRREVEERFSSGLRDLPIHSVPFRR